MPTHIVNTHEAKSRLSELIREAEEGADVIVARNGRVVAKIIAWPPPQAARVAGAWTNRVDYSTDLVGPDSDVASLFEESANNEPS